MPRKHTYEYVQSVFNERNCTLLSKEYVNSTTKLRYICICGKESTTMFTNFLRGHMCSNCGGARSADKTRNSYEKVDAIFKEADCELITTEYKNNQQVLEFTCSCGRPSKTSLANFQRGVRCYECGLDRLRGANHPMWNPNKAESNRNTPEYKKWRTEVLKRDEYTRQRCGEVHWAMTVHHVRNFKDAIDFRYDIDNAITLCRKCHTEFHVNYKYRDNDGNQLMQFFLDREESNPWYAGESFE